ncbi:MAG: hypothetical protein FIA95_09035, partial [Gemmatimonadetes bacterium]|nr:hypothetical protein [Gemmatimonadota bacterium]
LTGTREQALLARLADFPEALAEAARELAPHQIAFYLKDLAAAFHESGAEAAAALAVQLCGAEGLDTVALGGGCFQNVRLLAGVAARLDRAGVRVLVPRLLGPNDGAVSYGQAVVASARMEG